jgi:gluconolactonase
MIPVSRILTTCAALLAVAALDGAAATHPSWVAAMTTVLSADESDLVASGAKPKKLAGGFRFTEGPAADKDGNVYFTDIPNNRIHKWDVATQKLSTFREKSGGANGLYFDKDRNLLACEGGNRRMTLISPKGKVTVLTDKYEGKRYNSPNDLWIAPNGGVYFTDPRYGSMQGREIDGFHVYYISPDRKKVTRVIDDLKKPNGLIGTKDGKTLYVADPGAGVTYRYKVNADGSLSGKTLFCKSGSDGMTLDEKGNVYLTRGTVLVFNPQGKQIASLKFPEGPANVTFGGKDGKTLFVTAQTGFYSLEMNVKGQ